MTVPASLAHAETNDLEAFFMPFTSNRQFKKAPRLLVGAEGVHYIARDGRRILDGSAGLWCVNAGHGRKEIADAIKAQADHMDYAPSFQMGHPAAFELASRIANIAPTGLDTVFFANSGSEAVDTALKIAIAYHRANGDAQRTRLIGRERGYHGIGFGGMSVGGIKGNRKMFGVMLPGVDHLPHTYDLEQNAFSRGLPAHGANLADRLEDICELHDPSTIAAVIVEPVAGSTGVLPPPQDYLQRLRKICDKHGILLIFDEVITGFGRVGAPFAADAFGVTPDMMTIAKGMTNGAVPASAVVMGRSIYDAFMTGPEWAIELAHGYTYSAHPLAVAAGLATLDIYRDEGLFERSAQMAPHFENAIHDLKDAGPAIDIRNIGMMGAIELAPRPDEPGKRGFDVFLRCFEEGLYLRASGDALALSPPLIATESEIDEMMSILRSAIKATA